MICYIARIIVSPSQGSRASLQACARSRCSQPPLAGSCLPAHVQGLCAPSLHFLGLVRPLWCPRETVLSSQKGTSMARFVAVVVHLFPHALNVTALPWHMFSRHLKWHVFCGGETTCSPHPWESQLQSKANARCAQVWVYALLHLHSGASCPLYKFRLGLFVPIFPLRLPVG